MIVVSRAPECSYNFSFLSCGIRCRKHSTWNQFFKVSTGSVVILCMTFRLLKPRYAICVDSLQLSHRPHDHRLSDRDHRLCDHWLSNRGLSDHGPSDHGLSVHRSSDHRINDRRLDSVAITDSDPVITNSMMMDSWITTWCSRLHKVWGGVVNWE